MVKFRRMTRTESTKRANPFGAVVTDIVEDEYEIEAEDAGQICVIIQAQEGEKRAFQE